MPRYNAPFEIHVHGDVPLRAEVTLEQIEEALKPLWKYAGAKSLAEGAGSAYEEEPGIRFEPKTHTLEMCWTVPGDEDFRQSLDEMCMALNDLAEQGAAIEISFYDTDFDEDEDGDPDEESRDDFVMLFVGPIRPPSCRCKRDLLVEDVVGLMERHFDGAELSGVVAEIDKLFGQRFDALVNSLGDRQASPRRRCARRGQPRRRSAAAPFALSSARHVTLAVEAQALFDRLARRYLFNAVAVDEAGPARGLRRPNQQVGHGRLRRQLGLWLDRSCGARTFEGADASAIPLTLIDRNPGRIQHLAQPVAAQQI